MLLATKTLEAINAAIERDQGAVFRGHLKETIAQVGDAYSTDTDPWRNHLGASMIGRECARELWYGFRWSTMPEYDGRMLRLFNRGHLEEARFVAMLLTIGCKVWQFTETGKQFRLLGHRGHFGGSLDGVVSGIPDRPDEPVLAEFKTHNDASFSKLVSVGVIAAKWEHFIQMQQYMGAYGLKWAMYGAVNKNDDSLHLEMVQFDPSQYQRYKDRSALIIDSQDPPPKVNESPGWFKCKWCNHKAVCHMKAAPAKNCRTCCHVLPVDDGKWICRQDGGQGFEINSLDQRIGCENYKAHPCFGK